MEGKTDYEYTIALPYYLEKEFKHTLPSHIQDNLFYDVLKLDYNFERGLINSQHKPSLLSLIINYC